MKILFSFPNFGEPWTLNNSLHLFVGSGPTHLKTLQNQILKNKIPPNNQPTKNPNTRVWGYGLSSNHCNNHTLYSFSVPTPKPRIVVGSAHWDPTVIPRVAGKLPAHWLCILLAWNYCTYQQMVGNYNRPCIFLPQ